MMTKAFTQAAPVSVRDIAQACGLHYTTVSYALRGDRRHASEATIARVMAVAEQLGYDALANDNARRLSLQRRGVRPRRMVIGILT